MPDLLKGHKREQLIKLYKKLLEGNVMEANMESIKSAQEKFAELIQSEFERIEAV